MRQAYIVTYDVCDPKRLRKVFIAMKGYGEHLQLSVFRCELNPTELVTLRDKLGRVINHNEDQVLFVDMGPSEGRARHAIQSVGKPYAPPERTAIVV